MRSAFTSRSRTPLKSGPRRTQEQRGVKRFAQPRPAVRTVKVLVLERMLSYARKKKALAAAEYEKQQLFEHQQRMRDEGKSVQAVNTTEQQRLLNTYTRIAKNTVATPLNKEFTEEFTKDLDKFVETDAVVRKQLDKALLKYEADLEEEKTATIQDLLQEDYNDGDPMDGPATDWDDPAQAYNYRVQKVRDEHAYEELRVYLDQVLQLLCSSNGVRKGFKTYLRKLVEDELEKIEEEKIFKAEQEQEEKKQKEQEERQKLRAATLGPSSSFSSASSSSARGINRPAGGRGPRGSSGSASTALLPLPISGGPRHEGVDQELPSRTSVSALGLDNPMASFRRFQPVDMEAQIDFFPGYPGTREETIRRWREAWAAEQNQNQQQQMNNGHQPPAPPAPPRAALLIPDAARRPGAPLNEDPPQHLPGQVAGYYLQHENQLPPVPPYNPAEHHNHQPQALPAGFQPAHEAQLPAGFQRQALPAGFQRQALPAGFQRQPLPAGFQPSYSQPAVVASTRPPGLPLPGAPFVSEELPRRPPSAEEKKQLPSTESRNGTTSSTNSLSTESLPRWSSCWSAGFCSRSRNLPSELWTQL
ncbi:unnamed protein product [Amoebophrya sp. A120]|nr:unnamed protein product [Amoebophrya sp. A120]|eukprot:GSA120T00020415001.1